MAAALRPASTSPLFTVNTAFASPALSWARICFQRLPGVGRLGRVLPGHLERGGRLDRVELQRRDHGEEVTLPDDLRTRDVRDRGRVDRHDRSAGAERPLSAGTDDACVPHAGDPDVVHVGVRPCCLGRDVDPRHERRDDLVRADRLRDALSGVQVRGRDLRADQLAADQLPVGDRLPAARDRAVRHRKARRPGRRGWSTPC